MPEDNSLVDELYAALSFLYEVEPKGLSEKARISLGAAAVSLFVAIGTITGETAQEIQNRTS